MSDVMADRRDAARYPLIVMAEVTLVSSGVKIVARTSDVSRTGCYVDTRNPPPAGTQILLCLTQQGQTFSTEARIVYVSPGLGMGVRFQEYVTEAQLVTLDRWLGEAAKNG